MKWALVLVGVVAVGGAVWLGGTLGNSSSDETATIVNAPGPNGGVVATDAAIDSDIAAIDAQITSISGAIAPFSASTPTKAQIMPVATNFQSVSALIAKTITELQSRAATGKVTSSSTAAKAALADASRQISNMTSQSMSANRNAGMASSTPTTRKGAVTQLQTALTDLQTARADLGVAKQDLSIK